MTLSFCIECLDDSVCHHRWDSNSDLYRDVVTREETRGNDHSPEFLEIAAIGSRILFTTVDRASIPASVNGVIACLAAVIHFARIPRWRTLELLSTPIILGMHVGYAWLVVAMALCRVADVFGLVQKHLGSTPSPSAPSA